jgi:ATP-dependent RNA helicase SUPV3L1/SUV3
MFMGADTAAALLTSIVPGIEIERRPRFSTLTYAGHRKITRLPKRSAVVAFSAGDVYAIAELIRRQRGGAAVVLGALSPRTRNAQVAMYQNGEVDYLVATDAIGMGLNMDVDHVAFAGTRKFDGRIKRALTPAELGQIAGRAGRHMNDGTFGTTGEIPPLDEEVVARIENHDFESVHHLYWRNTDLKFHAVDALRHSLHARPPAPGLIRAREADDEMALTALAADPKVRPLANSPSAVRLLWEVCRIPDFRKVMSDDHARLLGRIYRHLREDGKLPEDWIADHVKRLDRTDGDIDTLSTRIAHIRTWTYVAYHGDWLADAAGWQARTRAVEDTLSDALHDKLTQRFVDKRTSVLLKRMDGGDALDAHVGRDGTVEVAGHAVGHLAGFRFRAERTGGTLADKAAANAALKALPGEIAARLERMSMDDDTTFTLDQSGRVLWRDEPVADLVRSADPLKPEVRVLASDLLEASGRDRVAARVQRWLDALLADGLGPLLGIRDADLKGSARGIAFQLAEGFGSIRRHRAKELVDALTREDRQALRAHGMRIGRDTLYMPQLLKPKAQRLTVLLWALWHGIDPVPAPPPEGRVSIPRDDTAPMGYYAAAGFRVLGSLAIRFDMAERLAGLAWDASKAGPFVPDETFLSLAGCTHDQLPGVLAGLGYAPRKPRKKKPAERAPETASPETAQGTTDETVQADTTAEAGEPAGSATEVPAEARAEAADETPAAPEPAGKDEQAKPEPVYYGRVLHKITGQGRPRPPSKKGKGPKGAAQGAPKGKGAKGKGGRKKTPRYDPDSPFAKLKDLKLG